MAVVVVTAAVAVGFGVTVVQRHRAAAAADAAALTVALRAIDGASAACRAGEAIAHLDGATVTRCVLDGADAEVAVAVRLPGPLTRLGPAVGRARAGPASAVGSLSPSTRR
jgi:secretion/DNA translocation related TadE-like protein